MNEQSTINKWVNKKVPVSDHPTLFLSTVSFVLFIDSCLSLFDIYCLLFIIFCTTRMIPIINNSFKILNKSLMVNSFDETIRLFNYRCSDAQASKVETLRYKLYYKKSKLSTQESREGTVSSIKNTKSS